MTVIRFPQEQRQPDRDTNRVHPGEATIVILPCIRIERQPLSAEASDDGGE